MEEKAIRSQIESQEKQAAAEKEVIQYYFGEINFIKHINYLYRLFDNVLWHLFQLNQNLVIKLQKSDLDFL